MKLAEMIVGQTMTKMVFNSAYALNSIDKMKKSVKRVSDILDENSDKNSPVYISKSDLSSLVYECELLALSGRKFIEIAEKNVEIQSKDFEFSYNKNLPVSVDFSDDTLRVFTPLTFKRFYRDKSMKENYQLMNYVSAALKEWSEKNKFDLWHRVKLPLVVVIKRKSHKWTRSTIPDADNMENGRIINEIIINTFGYSDNAMNMTIINTFKIIPESEPEGTEFIVFSKDSLGSHLNDI